LLHELNHTCHTCLGNDEVLDPKYYECSTYCKEFELEGIVTANTSEAILICNECVEDYNHWNKYVEECQTTCKEFND